MPRPSFRSGEGWISAGTFLEALKAGTWISTWVIGLRFGGTNRDFLTMQSLEASRFLSGVQANSVGGLLEALKTGTSTSTCVIGLLFRGEDLKTGTSTSD